MTKVTQTSSRKSEHIRINLEENVESGLDTGLQRYSFTHQALPELDLEDVDLGLSLFGKRLNAPVLISSMTGGTPEAAKINRALAVAAEACGVAMGLGSQRAAIEDASLADSFEVRKEAPGAMLFANLGAVQLNYGYGVKECQQAVDMIAADALILHLNPLQEAVQPEGDTRFSGLLSKIEAVCKALPVPVIAKEVGWGFSEQTARQLAEAGVAAIDIAGAGGTSWSQVEMHRASTARQARLAGAFLDWGIPTADSILAVRRGAPQLDILASGGLRSGIDIAKCIALGARLGGMAGPFLKAAAGEFESAVEATIQTIEDIRREIQICMFAAGAGDLEQLQKTPLVERPTHS
ncbi:MAG: type 2 isopentenyl-diphosphate Delta-isomerase [Anaerolineae bacterium]|nr:type 2 isopentenyl-diphosphate Delta-isomerase [Anaerolineae bacterium]